ncbi:Rabphilin 3Alike (Without C2 domains), partial [Caligus rogercresseyi]
MPKYVFPEDGKGYSTTAVTPTTLPFRTTVRTWASPLALVLLVVVAAPWAGPCLSSGSFPGVYKGMLLSGRHHSDDEEDDEEDDSDEVAEGMLARRRILNNNHRLSKDADSDDSGGPINKL